MTFTKCQYKGGAKWKDKLVKAASTFISTMDDIGTSTTKYTVDTVPEST